MNKRDTGTITDLICYHFISPVKEHGVDHDQIAENAMRFIQDLCKAFPQLIEQISFFETPTNLIAGSEFLDDLRIKQ